MENKIEIIRNNNAESIKLPANYVSGEASAEKLLLDNNALNITAALIHFEEGVITTWHTHPAGQVIIVKDGVCRFQQEGGEIMKAYPGDVVYFPPKIKHWHGAEIGHTMSHYALDGIKNNKTADWLEKVEE